MQRQLFTVYLWSISKESDELYSLTRGRLQLSLKASVMKGLTICHIRNGTYYRQCTLDL